jgi:pyruvate/2-oxoglutarate dehydrogenase complex dihydrolipoamide acyltransferase (E2) component
VSSLHTDVLVDVTMPQMGVSVAEGTVVAWRVDVGDRIEAEQTICEISTDKIDTDVPAPAGGVVAEIVVGVEETVAVGTVLARIATPGHGASVAHDDGDPGLPPPSSAPGPSSAPVPSAESAPIPRRRGPGERPWYSPVVSRIAAEHGIDLSTVTGTGRGGRVRKQDVLAVVNGSGNGEVGAGPSEPPLHIESPYRPEPAPAPEPPGAVAAIAGEGLSRMRRQIGEHMKRSLQTAATCTTWIEADMSRVEAARAKLGVTALAFVARATIDALREHPSLNAWLDGDSYTRVSDVNLGIAVSLAEDGLIVPVIHRAQELSVEGLAARVRDLARRARARELTADEVRGATFTITNPGQYGSIMATPIINQPQVAILATDGIARRPVVVTQSDGSESIAIHSTGILGVSWDHRAVDGAYVSLFLARISDLLSSRDWAAEL